MTRIVSFSLYQCPNCQQIHIKPNYGSINLSFSVPIDAYDFAKTDIKSCQKCGIETAIEDYKFLGSRNRMGSEKPNIIKRVAIKLGFAKAIEERDVRKLYPYFNYP